MTEIYIFFLLSSSSFFFCYSFSVNWCTSVRILFSFVHSLLIHAVCCVSPMFWSLSVMCMVMSEHPNTYIIDRANILCLNCQTSDIYCRAYCGFVEGDTWISTAQTVNMHWIDFSWTLNIERWYDFDTPVNLMSKTRKWNKNARWPTQYTMSQIDLFLRTEQFCQ